MAAIGTTVRITRGGAPAIALPRIQPPPHSTMLRTPSAIAYFSSRATPPSLSSPVPVGRARLVSMHPAARLALPGHRPGGVDQRDVTVGLRHVAELASPFRVELFGQ